MREFFHSWAFSTQQRIKGLSAALVAICCAAAARSIYLRRSRAWSIGQAIYGSRSAEAGCGQRNSDLGDGGNEIVGSQRRCSQAASHSGRSINSLTLVQIEKIVDESIRMRCNDTIRCQRGCWEILQIDRYDQFSPG